MQFNSYSYLLFLAAAVGVFWIMPARFRRIYVLLVSFAFYASWHPLLLIIPLGICGSAYLFGTLIIVKREHARIWLWSGVASILALLAFFKYRAFLLANINFLLAATGVHPLSWTAAVALPLGISFYSFEAISYLIDTSQRRLAKPNFLDLCLFILFWPHLIAGPIVRVRELVPQLKFNSTLDAGLFIAGIDRLVWGLVQKNVIANSLGAWVDSAFKSGGVYSSLDSWFLTLAFGMQIYFDFAAYSNMAIGAAQLIGIRLPENFRYPYHAATPVEFWARWHMTLSRWIRDYLFFPINAKFSGAPLPLYSSLLAVMALVGLWHGAGWGFILWGVLQGSYLVLYRMYQAWAEGRSLRPAQSRLMAAGWRLFTLLGVMVAWVPFRASTITQAGHMLATMLFRFTRTTAFDRSFYLLVVGTFIFTFAEPYLASLVSRIDDAACRSTAIMAGRLMARPVVYACGLLLFMIFDQQDAQFIYFQF